jgi:predicted helicase
MSTLRKIDMDWDNPEARAELVERVGLQEYNRLFENHREASIVSVVNGYAIRPVMTRFGQLFLVDGAGQAFFTLKEAEHCAWTRGSD